MDRGDLFPFKVFLPLLFLAFSLTGCAQGEVEDRSYDLMLKGLLSEKVPFISVDSLSSLDSSGYILLDARSKEEFDVSRIPGAIWVGQEYDPQRIPELPNDRKVITYCAVGKRSEDLGAALQKEEGVEVMNLYGGIFEWVNQENPVVNDDSTTRRVHAYAKKWGVWLRKGVKVYEPKPGEGASP